MAVSPVQSTHSGSVACMEGSFRAEGITIPDDLKTVLLMIENGELPQSVFSELRQLVIAGRSPLEILDLY